MGEEGAVSAVGPVIGRMAKFIRLTSGASTRVKRPIRHSAASRGSADFLNERASRETIIGRNLQNVESGGFGFFSLGSNSPCMQIG